MLLLRLDGLLTSLNYRFYSFKLELYSSMIVVYYLKSWRYKIWITDQSVLIFMSVLSTLWQKAFDSTFLLWLTKTVAKLPMKTSSRTPVKHFTVYRDALDLENSLYAMNSAIEIDTIPCVIAKHRDTSWVEHVNMVPSEHVINPKRANTKTDNTKLSVLVWWHALFCPTLAHPVSRSL